VAVCRCFCKTIANEFHNNDFMKPVRDRHHCHSQAIDSAHARFATGSPFRASRLDQRFVADRPAGGHRVVAVMTDQPVGRAARRRKR
jgi:hypothetical protein